MRVCVYTTKIISTIVDRIDGVTFVGGLYDKDNFYYCRSCQPFSYAGRVYTTKIISTIVDVCFVEQFSDVYTTKIISTIVDFLYWFYKIDCLYGKDNFYYCR